MNDLINAKEAGELAELIDSILKVCRYVAFIGIGLLAWAHFRVPIQNALRFVQGLIFG